MGHWAKIRFSICFMLLMVVLVVSGGLCGNLDDPGSPTTAGGGAMYTIEDIYKLLNGDTSVAKRTGAFAEPSSGPTAGTGHTLDDVMDQVKHRSHVRKTGQTTSYAAGDDGALQKGVSWPSPRFTDNGNGTVTDNLTKLIWLKQANCPGTYRNWSTALSDVVQLNTNGTMNGNNCSDTSNGGSHQTDWRLPNAEELTSLIDTQFSGPALSNAQGTAKWTEGDAFSGVQSDGLFFYWSCTTYADDSAAAWIVNLANGSVDTVGGKTAPWRSVWPVRGGQ